MKKTRVLNVYRILYNGRYSDHVTDTASWFVKHFTDTFHAGAECVLWELVCKAAYRNTSHCGDEEIKSF